MFRRNIDKVKSMMREDLPALIVVSPPCIQFSQLQNLGGGPDPEKLEEATTLFNAAVELCLYQVRLGGRFVLEHPETSRAWDLPSAEKLRRCAEVEEVVFDMSQR